MSERDTCSEGTTDEMEFDEEIREFLIESNENLANLDRELVELEQNPQDLALISSAFRTIHTIKGTCGFFGYTILGSVTHVTENILSQVREGRRLLTPGLISLLLEAMDAVKALLAAIAATGEEGEDTTGPLRQRLEAAERAADLPAMTAAPEGLYPAPAVIHQPALDLVAGAEPPVAAPVPSAVDVKPAHAEPVPQASPPAATLSQGVSTPALLSPNPESPPSAPAPTPGHELEPLRVEPARLETVQVEPARQTARDPHLSDSTIRVEVALLNRLMNLVGELVLARNQLLEDTSTLTPTLLQTSQRLNLITSELQEGVMKTRMQPIGVVWNKLPRVVRDLASQCGKRIRIELEGAETDLDKTILEAIKDPLTHIVRNACDHGIEMPARRLERGKEPEGLLLLRAYHEGGVVNIEVSDDGAGIDPERVKAKAVEKGLLRPEQAAQMGTRDALHLIFLPGFSTAAEVTSISGRGVGMDVVKTNIEKIGGSVEVQNRGIGAGTTLRIKIPLTLAIIPGLVVTLAQPAERRQRRQDAPEEGTAQALALRRRAGDSRRPALADQDRFIIPQANLLELVRVEEARTRIEDIHGTPVFHHRGKLLPLIYLASVLGSTPSASSREPVSIVVVQAENRQMGLVVDRILDTQEIVVKPLGRQLKSLTCYLGATIMGDGRPALILDVAGLARLAGLGAAPAMEAAQAGASAAAGAEESTREMMLLFAAAGLDRVAVPLSMVDRLEDVQVTAMERAAGREVLCYRGGILPLRRLEEVLAALPVMVGRAGWPGGPVSGLAAGRNAGADPGANVPVVVFARGGERIGLIVDRILDIVHEPVQARQGTRMPGLLGSAMLGGRVTDLLDLDALFDPVDPLAEGQFPLTGPAAPGLSLPDLAAMPPTISALAAQSGGMR